MANRKKKSITVEVLAAALREAEYECVDVPWQQSKRHSSVVLDRCNSVVANFRDPSVAAFVVAAVNKAKQDVDAAADAAAAA